MNHDTTTNLMNQMAREETYYVDPKRLPSHRLTELMNQATYPIGGIGDCAVPVTTIATLTANLLEAAGSVNGQLIKLEERLNPILGPEGPCAELKPNSSGSVNSSIAQGLSEALHRMTCIAEHLRELQRRVDL